jgi:hypothetical protein
MSQIMYNCRSTSKTWLESVQKMVNDIKKEPKSSTQRDNLATMRLLLEDAKKEPQQAGQTIKPASTAAPNASKKPVQVTTRPQLEGVLWQYSASALCHWLGSIGRTAEEAVQLLDRLGFGYGFSPKHHVRYWQSYKIPAVSEEHGAEVLALLK